MAADPDSRVKDVLDDILTLVGGGGGIDARIDALEAGALIASADRLSSGTETLTRALIMSTAVITTTQVLRLTYFTALRDVASTQVRLFTGGTAAGATPTVARVGLYSIAANGDGTLVASTANDTALFGTQNTAYTKSWSAPYAVVKGTRYALGVLVVTGATAPTLAGTVAPQNSIQTEWLVAPAIAASITAQADLPASFVAGSLGGSASRMYAAILP
jgi:hypothetical protein